MLISNKGIMPEVDKETFLAKGVKIIGKVKIERGVSIWFNAVIRGDIEPILIEENTNIQDCCVLHTDRGCPLTIGKGVTVGHGAILHGCTIHDGALVGFGSRILNGAELGKECMIGAGAVVTPQTKIPSGMLAVGLPAKVIRPLTEEELNANRELNLIYLRRWQEEYRFAEIKE